MDFETLGPLAASSLCSGHYSLCTTYCTPGI